MLVRDFKFWAQWWMYSDFTVMCVWVWVFIFVYVYTIDSRNVLNLSIFSGGKANSVGTLQSRNVKIKSLHTFTKALEKTKKNSWKTGYSYPKSVFYKIAKCLPDIHILLLSIEHQIFNIYIDSRGAIYRHSNNFARSKTRNQYL